MRMMRKGIGSLPLNGLPVFLALAVMVAVTAACSRNSEAGNDSGIRLSVVGPDGNGGATSSASDDGYVSDDGGDQDDQVVSNQNPGGDPVKLKERGEALENASSIDVVRWTAGPFIREGEAEFVAKGVLEQDARLFDPLSGEGSAFSVYYDGHEEALVELVPEPGPASYWDTNATIAPTEIERDGNAFSIRAYSPLFMDAGDGSQLHLRVWGYDGDGQEALLSAQGIGPE